MNLEEFKKQYVIGELGISKSYGKIMTVIDFGNVNYWFNEDRQDSENKLLKDDEKFRIKLPALYDFISLFSDHVRFYYGHDPSRHESIGFLSATRSIFGKKVFTKPIQKVRHHLSPEEIFSNKRDTFSDGEGVYVHVPKCNFDVEISVDSMRLLDQYDTLALFSSDADFISLIRFLKGKGKKIILFKGGFISSDLRKGVDKIINAQNIKRHIAEVVKKQKPGI